VPRILVVDDNPELLALLSSAFEEAGYTVQTAQRGRAAIELAKKERPDLAVVDVLLPDVMGFEVGEALQRQRVPVAFMSGVHKGGKAAANATFKYGAVGYFEKPFERKTLLALVEKLVPVRPAKPAQAWDVESAPGVDGPGDAMELTGSIDLTSGETSSKIQGAKLRLRGGIAATRTPLPPLPPPVLTPSMYVQMTSLPPTPRSQLMKPSSAPGQPKPPSGSFNIDVGLPPSAPRASASTSSVAAQSRQSGPPPVPPSLPPKPTVPPPPPPDSLVSQPSGFQLLGPQPTPALKPSGKSSPGINRPPPPPLEALAELPRDRGSVHEGDIDDNLPQLFAAFLAAQETGELGLSRGQVKKIVYFEKGMPVFALSNLVAERLGQFLVRAGKIDEQTLKTVLQEASDTSQRTGDVLILMGLLTEQERLYYVGQQIKSILYSLFAWTDGRYQLSFQDKARKERIKLDIHPATLVLRGVKKLYKPERIARLLTLDDRPTPGIDPLFQLSDVELQGWEALMIAHCDGTRTARELIAQSGKSEAEALGTLAALISMRILEKRR
jgi:DNA-binding response OmpR family regulator